MQATFFYFIIISHEYKKLEIFLSWFAPYDTPNLIDFRVDVQFYNVTESVIPFVFGMNRQKMYDEQLSNSTENFHRFYIKL